MCVHQLFYSINTISRAQLDTNTPTLLNCLVSCTLLFHEFCNNFIYLLCSTGDIPGRRLRARREESPAAGGTCWYRPVCRPDADHHGIRQQQRISRSPTP